jgi:hypothetical protein
VSFGLTIAASSHTLLYVRVRSDALSNRGDAFGDQCDAPGVAYHGRGDRRDALILL